MDKEDVYNIHKIREIIKLEEVTLKMSWNKLQDKYEFIDKVLLDSKYIYKTKKKDKIVIRLFIQKVTGIGKVQLKRLISRKIKGEKLVVGYTHRDHKRKYNHDDIKLLAHTDNVHKRMNGNATQVNLQREYNIYNKKEYANIQSISVSHIYRIRKVSDVYRLSNMSYNKTQAVQRSIGVRKKPNNDGKPGYIRVDSVHQGDMDGEKGVYYVNVVDEVTQWEYVGCVEGISEYFLLPVLLDLIESFPFKIVNFHSDNGSEYINYQVAGLLDKLVIDQTKSRSRRSTDNGLVESKNASIIRKIMGHTHIPRKHADTIDTFLKGYFNTYINYHRVCAYPTKIVNSKGKVKVIYKEYNTPFRKLLSINNYEIYFKDNMNKDKLLAIEMEMSDNESAENVRKEYKKLRINIAKVTESL